MISDPTLFALEAHILDSTSNIIGRWRLSAFLIYLQGQVYTFAKVVATAMEILYGFIIKLLHLVITTPTPPNISSCFFFPYLFGHLILTHTNLLFEGDGI